MNSRKLRYQYEMLNVAEKLIVINAVIFIVFNLITFLFKIDISWFLDWFYLPESLQSFVFRPWTVLSYAFLHDGIFHIFFNMLLLYYMGRIFLNVLDSKRFLNVYLLGAICGGLFFVLAYNIFPVFMQKDAALVGASAAVMAITIFVATYLANTEIMVFMFRVKLWQLGLFFVILDLVLIPANNAGGRIAHLGGAFLGYLYASRLQSGVDIGKPFGRAIEAIGDLFKTKKQKPFRKVYKEKATPPRQARRKPEPTEKQQKIDRILDKISKSGYDSLSKEEKDFLFQSGRD
ncbi:MAG: rhomboid family intramembrane serine protease [Flavobacteriaceae bacterium]|nr:rhomboid family intramembrane serine protease [Flavobacteriaceae bacterium]